VPDAVTENDAEPVSPPTCGVGATAITGATPSTSVRTAIELDVDPSEFVANTVYDPASDVWRLFSVSDAPVAPAMAAPSFRHWYVTVDALVAAALKVTEPPVYAD
jgi:hypothetical protein